MTKLARLAALLLAVILAIFTFLPFLAKRGNKPIVLVSPLAKTVSAHPISPAASFGQLVNNSKDSLASQPQVTEETNKPVSLLILGLDARKGDKNPRCDAIHIITFDPRQDKVLITSLPRGTLVEIPGVKKRRRYLGNSCHLMGIDFAVNKIEKITGIHPDYTLKLGFSQVLGILRLLNLPTTPTLQFLRSRRYPRGDYQRSRNQALFIKDMIISKLSFFSNLPKPIQYLAFKMVDTDLDFEKAIFFLRQILNSKIHKEPDRIELVSKPNLSLSLKEVHFDKEKFQNESVWQNDREFQKYQDKLETYLRNLIRRSNKYYQANNNSKAFQLINTPFHQQLWLQIEDSKKRNLLHFELLRLFALTSPDPNNITTFVLDFITEMESVKQTELKSEAEELLSLIINKTFPT